MAVVESSDRSESVVLVDARGRLGNAGAEGTDVKGAGCSGKTEPHLAPDTVSCHTWLAVGSTVIQRDNQDSVGVWQTWP